MIFYCPNCKRLEIGKVSYTERDYIFNNCRDGYGLGLHNVICKECEYPLSAVVCDHKITKEDIEGIEYWKYVITSYQNGMFANKNDMLLLLIKRYEMDNRNNKVVDVCKKFIDTNY